MALKDKAAKEFLILTDLDTTDWSYLNMFFSVGFGQRAETECSFLITVGVMYYNQIFWPGKFILPFGAANTGVDYSAETSGRYRWCNFFVY